MLINWNNWNQWWQIIKFYVPGIFSVMICIKIYIFKHFTSSNKSFLNRLTWCLYWQVSKLQFTNSCCLHVSKLQLQIPDGVLHLLFRSPKTINQITGIFANGFKTNSNWSNQSYLQRIEFWNHSSKTFI